MLVVLNIYQRVVVVSRGGGGVGGVGESSTVQYNSIATAALSKKTDPILPTALQVRMNTMLHQQSYEILLPVV
jgi:hypothetical protein